MVGWYRGVINEWVVTIKGALLFSVYGNIPVQGIRNDDDQSLSPVTPLVSLLFLSFLIHF